MRSPFTRGRLYAAMTLSALCALFWPLSYLLPAGALAGGTLATGVTAVFMMPYILLIGSVLGGAAVFGVPHRPGVPLSAHMGHALAVWIVTLPLSFVYAWVGSVLWRAVRRRESN